MANCLVPSCPCSHYEGPEKGRVLAYRPDCGGCGHQKTLHRLPTNTDEVIMRELLAAESVPCCSLIPMSQLPSMKHFSSYDLIPIPPDEADNQAPSNVFCLCKGFVPNMPSILHQFTSVSFETIQSSLPSVPCTRCTHPLLMHQKTHPSHYLCEQRVLGLKGSLSLKRVTLPSPGLVDLALGPDKRIGFVAVTQTDSSYQLVLFDKILAAEGKGVKRRSGRLAKRANATNRVEEEEEEKAAESDTSVSQQMIDFFNTALEAATPINEYLNQEPTTVCGYWTDTPTDHASSQFVVAVGTEGGVTIHIPSDGSYRNIETLQGVTVLHFLTVDNTLMLCVGEGESSGAIKCWGLKNDSTALLTEFNNIETSVTNLLWIEHNNYLFAGTELGQVYLFQLKSSADDKMENGQNGERDVGFSLELCQKIQSCLGPVTALHFCHSQRLILVGSADNDIHVLSLTTLVENLGKPGKDSLLTKYFPLKKKRADKLVHCARMKGHQSFVNSITGYCANVLSLGWDSYAMFWSPTEIGQEVATAIKLQGSSSSFQKQELSSSTVEPSLLYKLGVEQYLNNVPCGLWGILDECVVTVYQGTGKQLIIALY
ncbi:PREDICTED: uncharacterized protein LOC100636966 [Amphimedon queenslandica]|uniref:Uncharacterized protein n=1 Tax=Amphimedon queenslandica TaxID=400682 RepID=A0A1X7U6U3_AMPQE|nr:PREDICTED: uncharacterized protein LOC100636966 [Amphimedon queenslandica]|eukprot:XP_019855911.1 PREDICTED: uncharacterized protein LOC100636966 [Amphimedon queenslandica]